ncbi:hypothetical protein [Acidovorax sp. A1169]|uniref:hypothetical protein n=1 Tax=Acidovorax sp. A1169 TaxID=3059524 RepID=UPI002737EFEC|nr:hypothetical protein [Acidovorax sp. A1169]MDP4076227.1 hypothetical protein [Acidovorax sp. A1169]
MEKKLKAYEVREPDEGHCCIEFATSNAAARRQGANELGTEFEYVEHCRRAPWADAYAPGPVPVEATLAAGWRWGCQHCDCTFDIDGRGYDEDDEREDDFGPVGDERSGVYCSETCQQQEWAERRARKVLECAVIEAAAAAYPDATNITAHEDYGTDPKSGRRLSDATHWKAVFRVPGLQYGVHWILGDDCVSVSQCDVEAWNARKAQQEAAHA